MLLELAPNRLLKEASDCRMRKKDYSKGSPSTMFLRTPATPVLQTISSVGFEVAESSELTTAKQNDDTAHEAPGLLTANTFRSRYKHNRIETSVKIMQTPRTPKTMLI